MHPHLYDFISSVSTYFRFPSLSLCILSKTETSYFSIGCEKNAGFKVGSLTKLVTALTLLKLEEEGFLNLTDKASLHLPWLTALPNSSFSLLDLLLHTSGLPRGKVYTENPSPEIIKKETLSLNHLFEKAPSPFYKYSNLSYFLLGLVIEEVCKRKYEKVVQEKIFAPLGMKESGFGKATNVENITQPHGLRYFSSQNTSPYDYWAMPLYSAPYAAFDMHTTSGDMAKLMQCVLAEGEYHGQTLWKKESIQALFHHKFPIHAQLFSSIGMLHEVVSERELFFQGAEHWGHSAAMLFLPKENFALLALTNRGGAAQPLVKMAKSIVQFLHSKEENKPLRFEPSPFPLLSGEYISENKGKILLTEEEKILYLSYENEPKSLLIYVGNGAFLPTESSLSPYFIKIDRQKGKTVGLFVGEFYFWKKEYPPSLPFLKKYAAVTGFYFHEKTGRIALFERKNQLVLAYSPFQEAILQQENEQEFVQLTGAFIHEKVRINAEKQELFLGGLIFKKTT